MTLSGTFSPRRCIPILVKTMSLEWFFIAGLHQFYLGRWQLGLLDLGAQVIAIGCFISGLVWAGVAVLVIVYSWELWQLFRSQIIVQDWNNRLYRRLLSRR